MVMSVLKESIRLEFLNKNISQTLNMEMESLSLHNISLTTNTPLHLWKILWKSYI